MSSKPPSPFGYNQHRYRKVPKRVKQGGYWPFLIAFMLFIVFAASGCEPRADSPVDNAGPLINDTLVVVVEASYNGAGDAFRVDWKTTPKKANDDAGSIDINGHSDTLRRKVKKGQTLTITVIGNGGVSCRLRSDVTGELVKKTASDQVVCSFKYDK